MTVVLDEFTPETARAWDVLFEVSVAAPDHLLLVGGQMMALLCAEAGVRLRRFTADVEVVVNVRARPGSSRPWTSIGPGRSPRTPRATRPGSPRWWHDAYSVSAGSQPSMVGQPVSVFASAVWGASRRNTFPAWDRGPHEGPCPR